MAVIVDPFTWAEGEIPSAADWTLRFSTWVNEFNGGIDSDNILSASVIDENFADGIIGDEKMVSAVSMRPTANWCFKETNFGFASGGDETLWCADVAGSAGTLKRYSQEAGLQAGISNTTNGRIIFSYNFAKSAVSSEILNNSTDETDATHRILTMKGALSSPFSKASFGTFIYSPTDTKWILLNGWNFA